MAPPTRIVSGGQTGVDRAALDWAMARGIGTGGWCPDGRRAEDGRIPDRYPLKETAESAYDVRTRTNVRDSDATVIFSLSSKLSGGSLATREFAAALGRPWVHLSRDACGSVEDAAAALTGFLERHPAETLNVAGPRVSEEPEAGKFATSILTAAFTA